MKALRALHGRRQEVRRFLAGDRVVKRPLLPPPVCVDGEWQWYMAPFVTWTGSEPPPEVVARCPYGQPGDYLWVREAWFSLRHDGQRCVGYFADSRCRCSRTVAARRHIFQSANSMTPDRGRLFAKIKSVACVLEDQWNWIIEVEQWETQPPP